MNTTKYALVLVIGLMALAAPLAARADDFTFSFANNSGNIAGTVTGEILGLQDNTTGPASAVVLTSFPAALNSALGPAPITFTSTQPPSSLFENIFTETNGEITAANFLWHSIGPSEEELALNGFISGDYLSLDGSFSNSVANNGGFTSITFSPVPEPSSLLLLATGLIGLAGMTCRRKVLA